MPTNRKQRRQIVLSDRALDLSENPARRLRAAKALVELSNYSRRANGVARKVSNSIIADVQMPQDLRTTAIKLLEAVAIGEAARKNAVRSKVRIGDVIYQNDIPFRVTKIENGQVTGAEAIQ